MTPYLSDPRCTRSPRRRGPAPWSTACSCHRQDKIPAVAHIASRPARRDLRPHQARRRPPGQAAPPGGCQGGGDTRRRNQNQRHRALARVPAGHRGWSPQTSPPAASTWTTLSWSSTSTPRTTTRTICTAAGAPPGPEPPARSSRWRSTRRFGTSSGCTRRRASPRPPTTCRPGTTWSGSSRRRARPFPRPRPGTGQPDPEAPVRDAGRGTKPACGSVAAARRAWQPRGPVRGAGTTARSAVKENPGAAR